MKILWAIIPAAVLAMGAGAAGVLTGRAAEEKPRLTVDYTSLFSNNTKKADEVSNVPAVNVRAGAQGNFVDDNNDGICDNYANGTCPQDGTGYGHHRGSGNFVDDNNDGVCDNYANGVCPQDGTGYGHHRGSGNFVDNNDGVCDNYANGACPQNGTGHGCRRGR